MPELRRSPLPAPWTSGSRTVLAVLLAAVCLLVPSALLAPSPAAAAPARPAAPSATAPDPFYGTWYDGLSPDPAVARTDLDGIAASGIGLIRQYVFWDRIETSPGTYDWSRFDQLVTDATARGITILPTLLYTPSFYSSKPAGSTSTAQFPPADPQSLARFATAVVARYGPKGTYWCPPSKLPFLPPTCKDPTVPLRAWEVWNEPNYTSWWGGAPSAPAYADLLEAVGSAIHSADPGADVVLGALQNAAPIAGGYLDQLYDAGAGSSFDTLSINPYGYDSEHTVDLVRATRAVAARHGDAAKPLRVTEFGWATGGRSNSYVVDTPCQAALLYATATRLSGLRTELGLQSLVQFQWSDVATTTDAWPDYAGLHLPDGTAKPSLAAVEAAVAGRPAPDGDSLVDGCPPERRTDGVYRDAVRTDGAAAYLRLDDPAGSTTAADDRGLRPGTWVGTPELGDPSALVHDVDTSAGFSGDDGVDLGKGALLTGGSAGTVEAWVHSTARSQQVLYLEQAPGTAGRVRVDLNAAGRLRLQFQSPVKGATVQMVVGKAVVADGGWHSVAVTRDGTAVVLYVDGAVDRSATLSSATTTTSPPAGTRVVLGRDLLHGTAGLVGGLDEVAVYPVALTAAQVGAHRAES